MLSDERPDPELWLADSRGQYIPQAFALSFKDRDKDVEGVTAEEWAVLEAGPDHEQYWDVWEQVLTDAIVTLDGTEHTLWQDGDLWLIPDGMEWDGDKQGWIWPEDEDEDEDEEPDA